MFKPDKRNISEQNSLRNFPGKFAGLRGFSSAWEIFSSALGKSFCVLVLSFLIFQQYQNNFEE